MSTSLVRSMSRKLVCVIASLSMVFLLVPAISMASVQDAFASMLTTRSANTATITVKRVSTGKLTLKVGASYKLGAQVSSGSLTYSSSKKSVVSVSKAGTLKANKAGKATITCKISGTSVAKKIAVTVVKAAKYKQVKSIKLYYNASSSNPYSTTYSSKYAKAIGSSKNASVGTVMALCAKFNPSATSNKNLTYASSNTKVAKVSAAGVVSVVGAGSAKITVTSCSNSKVKANFKIVATAASDDANSAVLSCEDSMTKGATYAALSFTSDTALSDDFDASDVTLSGCLKEYDVDYAEAYDANSFYVLAWVKDGKEAAARTDTDEYGYVTLDASAFAGDVMYGNGAVSTSERMATIETDESLTSYNAYTHVLTLALDLGSAQASKYLNPTCVSLPADEENEIGITGVTVNSEDSSEIFVGLDLGEYNEEGDTFDRLDGYLTSGGIEIAAEGLNTNSDLTVVSQEVQAGEEAGYETSALDFLQPLVCGDVQAPEWKACSNGSVEASVKVNFDEEGYSDFAQINFVSAKNMYGKVYWANDNKTRIFDYDVFAEYVDNTTVSFGFTMNSDIAAAYGVYTSDGELDTDLLEQLFDQDLNYQTLMLDGGIVKNGLGIPISLVEAYFTLGFIDYDEYWDDESEDDSGYSTLSVNTLAEDDEADDEEDDDAAGVNWDDVRSFAAELITAGGSLIWGISSGDWGYISGGVGGLLGFEGIDGGPSTEDIMDKLEAMDTKLSAISESVDKVNTRLNEIEARTMYHQDLTTLSTYLSNTEMYSSVISATAKQIELDDTDGDLTTVNDAQYADAAAMATKTQRLASVHKTSAQDDTIKLGNMLAGDSLTGATSVIKEYADYIGTYYNWQPETCPSVALFYARVACAYECGYHAALNELQVAHRNGEDVDAEFDELVKNHKKVTTALVGELTKASGKNTYQLKSGTESSIYKLTVVDASASKVLCTVNNKYYSKNAFVSKFFYGSKFADGKNFFPKDGEDLGNIGGGSSINTSEWKTMIERLESCSSHPYASLYEELGAMGFTLQPKMTSAILYENTYKYESNDSHGNRNIMYRYFPEEYCNLLIGTASRSNPTGSKGSWQAYEWHGAIVNLVTDEIDEAGKAMSAIDRFGENGWPWQWHWGTGYNLYAAAIPN